MSTFKRSLIAASIAGAIGALPMTASAQFVPGLNELFINNFENLYRLTTNCTPANPCFAHDPLNDPVGYSKPLPPGLGGVPNNVLAGDIFAGILNVQNIDAGGSTHFFSGPQNQLTGYFAQQVVSVSLPPLDPFDATQTIKSHITFTTPGIDPFGKLAAGESIRLYRDTGAGATPFESNGTTFDDVTKATDGALWVSMGLGAVPDPGYQYSHVDLTVDIGNFSDQEAYLAMDFIVNNTGLLFNRINDTNETELGGIASGINLGQCNKVGAASCNEIVGTVELEANQRGLAGGGTSPWLYASNDPMLVHAIPEPGSLALLGLGIGIAGLLGSRRRIPV